MSDIPVWNCEFSPLPGHPGLDALTVGARFTWKCHGDIPVAWETPPPKVAVGKPEESFTLSILKVIRQEPNDVQYEVTAYKAGEHQPQYLRVLQNQGTANEKGFEVSQPKWKVQSVLDPQKPAQPYAPFGPWQLTLPWWFLLTVLIVFVTLVFLIVRKVRKFSQRRRMLENLKLHRTAMAPLHQFYRDARQLRRRLHNVRDPSELKAISVDLDREFRLFVLRQFQIPTLDWSNRAILEDLRRRHRKTYRAAGEPLKKTLRELDKLKGRAKMSAGDVEQMHRMSLDAAEKLEQPGVRK